MKRKVPIVYLAGGFHSGWQSEVKREFENQQVMFIDPRDHSNVPRVYTKQDMQGIESSDVVFAYLEEGNPSGLGLAFEIGYAVALGKIVIFVNEKKDKYATILEEASMYTREYFNDGIKTLDYVIGVFRSGKEETIKE